MLDLVAVVYVWFLVEVVVLCCGFSKSRLWLITVLDLVDEESMVAGGEWL